MTGLIILGVVAVLAAFILLCVFLPAVGLTLLGIIVLLIVLVLNVPVGADAAYIGGEFTLAARANGFYAKDQADARLKRFNPYYTMHCLDCTKPYPGIFSALERLRDAGIQLAVATNKTQDFAEKIVSHIFGVILLSLTCP